MMQTKTQYVVANANRLAPHDLDAEQALLGAVMIDNDILFDVTTKPHEFYLEKHAALFDAMLALSREGHEIDSVTLTAQLKAAGKSALIEADYFAKLLDAVPSSIGYKRYAQLIRKAYTQRLVINAAGRIAEIGYSAQDQSDEELLSAVHSVAMNIESADTSLNGASLKDALSDSLDEIIEYLDGKQETWGVPTGLRDLDAYIGGLAIGEMTLIAADPGKGKTMLATTIALNAASRGHHGIFFSLEMTKRQLMLRMYSMCGKVATGEIRRGKLSAQQRDVMLDNVDRIRNYPLTIFDDPMDTDAIERAIMRQQRRGKVEFAIVDYSDLLKDHAENEVVRMKRISHALKNIFKRTQVAGVVVHPITRDANDDEPPDLRNLGWGRAWEYDAHTVLFPHFKKTRQDKMAAIKVGKYRDGVPNQKIECVFDGMGWYDVAKYS